MRRRERQREVGVGEDRWYPCIEREGIVEVREVEAGVEVELVEEVLKVSGCQNRGTSVESLAKVSMERWHTCNIN